MTTTDWIIPWDGENGRPMNALAVAGAAGSVALLAYALTCCRTLAYGGDCGDLIASSWVLGNCHPTGYPLYLVLGKLFAALPLGDVAFRYNLFSAVAGAGAVFVVALLVGRLTRCGVAAVAGGLTVGFLYVLWSQCVLAEVYALSVFLLCTVLLLACLWGAEGDARWLLAAGLVAGLAAAHHLSSVYVSVPTFAYCVGVSIKRRTGLPVVAAGLVFACLGLLLYAYLPIRASALPPMNWGDPSTWDRFVAHVTGRLYRSHMFGAPWSAVPQRLFAYGSLLVAQLLFSILWVPVGLVWLWRRRRGFALLLVAVASMNLALNLRYDVGDLWNFLLPAFLVPGILAGVGVGAFARTLAAGNATQAGRAALAAVVAGVCVLMQAAVVAPVPDINMGRNRTARAYNERTLASVAPEAALFVDSDENLFALQYLRHVEGRRAEVELLSVPRLEAFGDGLTGELSRRVGRQPVFCAFHPQQLVGRYALTCRGNTTEVSKKAPALRISTTRLGGSPLLHHAGVSLTLAVPPPLHVKKGNSVALDCRWRISRSDAVGGTHLVELVCAAGTPETATPAPGESAARRALTVSEVVRRWALTYPLAYGADLDSVGLDAGQTVVQRLLLTAPWNAETGVYQLFVRLCTDDGQPSPYEHVGELSVTQR